MNSIKNDRVYLGKKLQQDDIFPLSKIVDSYEITGMKARKGMEKLIISEDTIVNVVSNRYGHLPNQLFFGKVEEKLNLQGVNYITRSINRDNCSFMADYILKDDNYHIDVKGSNDILTPMLRFINSYDGTCKTSGHFGFWRQVCSNGLNVANIKISFGFKHTGDITDVVVPEINQLIQQFMSSEFHELKRKFEVLAETPISNINDFVKFTLGKTKLFKYEKSEKNPDPSKLSQSVIDKVYSEAIQLNVAPNYWLGYNAFNEVLHDELKKSFDTQKEADGRLFDVILQDALTQGN